MSEQEKKYSDFEQRRALQEFHRVATQQYVEEIADDLFIRRVDFSEKFKRLTDLTVEFENPIDEGHLHWVSYAIGRAIRYRDSELLNMLADELYKPCTGCHDKKFIDKMDAVYSNTAPPALRAIK